MPTEEFTVDTVEKARGLSLIKWEKVRDLHVEFMDAVDENCAFCDLGKYRMIETNSEAIGTGCNKCGVYDRCHEIQSEASNIETLMRTLIEKTIIFLKDMDVN